MNKLQMLGRLANEPTLTFTSGQDPTAVIKFAIAVRRNKENTDFFECVGFGKTAEFIKNYFKKGKLIAISGNLQNKRYKDKSGNNRSFVSIIVEEVHFAGETLSIVDSVNEDFYVPTKLSEAELPW